MRGLFRIVAFVAAGVLAGGAASAGKKECAQSYVDAQKAMKSQELRRAREQLVMCARDDCLPAVRKDCIEWLDQVNASFASIVVQATGPDGKDTFDVRLRVDGEVVAEHLDTHAIEIEPGTHKLRFEMAGQSPIDEDLIVRQGEKNHSVEVSFAPKPKTGGITTTSTTGGAQTRPARPNRIVPIVLGGVAVLALAGAGVFWGIAESSRSDLVNKQCAPNCNPDDVSGIKRDRLIGDVLLGLGIVAAGAAVYFLVTGTPKVSSAWRVEPGRGLVF